MNPSLRVIPLPERRSDSAVQDRFGSSLRSGEKQRFEARLKSLQEAARLLQWEAQIESAYMQSSFSSQEITTRSGTNGELQVAAAVSHEGDDPIPSSMPYYGTDTDDYHHNRS